MGNEQHFLYDVISELRRDPKRRKAILRAMDIADRVSQEVLEGKASRRDVTAAEADLVRLSGFNFGLLIPRFFPRYPLDEPLDFSSRPFMFAMTAQAPGSVVTLKAGRQVGKCADGDTVVTLEFGETCTLRDLFDEGIPVAS